MAKFSATSLSTWIIVPLVAWAGFMVLKYGLTAAGQSALAQKVP